MYQVFILFNDGTETPLYQWDFDRHLATSKYQTQWEADKAGQEFLQDEDVFGYSISRVKN